jgi:chromo domain-containing protein 1
MDISSAIIADDDDAVSVTSTIPDDTDAEWTVSDVLAEKEFEGQLQYLVKWQGRPLSEADWIAKDDLIEDAVTAWEAQKAENSGGSCSAFNLNEWKSAVEAYLRGKFTRREARNRKRRRLGLSQKEYEDTLESVLSHLNHYFAGDHGDQPRSSTTATLCQSDKGGNDTVPLNPNRLVSKQQTHPSPTAVLDCKKISLDQDETRHVGPSSEPRRFSIPGPGAFNKPSEESKVNQPTTRKSSITKLDPSNVATREASSREQPVRDEANKLPNRKRPLETDVRHHKRLRLVIPTHTRLPEKNRQDTSSTSSAASSSPRSCLRQSVDNTPSETTPGPQVKKKKKSVRWNDAFVESEPVQTKADDSLFVQEGQLSKPDAEENIVINTRKDTPFAPSPPQRSHDTTKLSLSDYSQRSSVNARTKACILDPKAAAPVKLIFDGIARDPNAWWFPDFDRLPCLNFTHTCTASDFQYYDSSVALREGKSNLIEGGVSLTEANDQISKSIDFMKIGELAWFGHNGSSCVILFPSQCEGWKAGNATESAISPHHPLRYWVFKPASALAPALLSPISFPKRLGKDGLFSGVENSNTKRPFGPEYGDLIPWGSKKVIHYFFLAFPQMRESEAALVSQWLRDSNPECRISTSLTPGHWEDFCKHENGVVLVHEDAMKAVGRFPGFYNLLHRSSTQYSFWALTRSLQSPSSCMIATQPEHLGQIRLQRVLYHGIAICLTPSFLLSQPEQAYNFFKWFWRNFFESKDTPNLGKLIVSAHIDDWLYDLILEKTHFREKSHRMSTIDLRIRGIHDEGLEARLKTLKLLQQLVAASVDNVDGPLIFAPDSIDGNDEQSLVNWFAWWTLGNTERFRKFSVIGSSESTPDRRRRYIKPPQYISGTVNNPDAWYIEDEDLESLGPKTQISQRGEGGGQNTAMTSTSRLLPNDRPENIEVYLTQVLHRIQFNRCPLILYKKPVSYWDPEMAFHFRDYYSTHYQSYARFLGFFMPFGKAHPSMGDNSPMATHIFTYAGVFHTIEGEWDPTKFPNDCEPVRNPWIAIFRPVNAFRKPWKEVELLIWDIKTSGRFSRGHEVFEEDLSEAQRKLIEALHIDIKTAEMPLTRIWLGGVDVPQKGLTNCLDITLRQLEFFAQDIKERVPLSEHKMEERGWLQVKPGNAPGGRQASLAVQPPNRIGNDAEDDPTGLKMIFHAPRRHPNHQPRASRCTNKLYAWAMDVSPRNSAELYTFWPTMVWYKDLLAEDRGFAHIKVTSWNAIFETYKIEDPKKT